MFGYVFIMRNNHSFVIVISLNKEWLFLPKRNIIVISLSYVIIIKYKTPRRPDQNIRLYLYLAFFSLLLFIFPSCSLSLSLSCFSSSLSSYLSLLFSLLLFIWFYLFLLSLFGHGGHLPLVGRVGPLSLLFLFLFVWLVFLICTVLIFFSPLYNHCC